MKATSAQTRRLFLALWPTPEVVDQIWQYVLPHFKVCHGRFLKPRNWHITLAYFGASDAATRQCLERQVQTIQARPFELQLSQCGYWKKPAVAWLAPENVPPALAQLAGDVQLAIQPCGYRPEDRPYRPHITLVRKAKHFPDTENIAPIHWVVERFCLVESKTLPDGAEYIVLEEYPFQ